MALWLASAEVLLRENARRPFSGRALTLGKLDFVAKPSALRRVLDRNGWHGLAPRSTDEMLRQLGFSSVASLDISDFEGADILYDLNSPEPPAELRDSADLILDGGTIEHVFNVPNALKACHAMLKVGGRIVHLTPASNYIDHGFYSFSPTLYHDWYTANGYEIDYLGVVRHSLRPDKDEHALYPYTPETFQRFSYGGVDDMMYMCICVATKLATSTAERVPQQGFYVRQWAAKSEAAPVSRWQAALRNLRPFYRFTRLLLVRHRLATLERR